MDKIKAKDTDYVVNNMFLVDTSPPCTAIMSIIIINCSGIELSVIPSKFLVMTQCSQHEQKAKLHSFQIYCTLAIRQLHTYYML